MSSTLFSDLSSYFNNIDPEDPIYQKDLIRPAEIKEDVKLMEQRKRVSNIMRSKLFKKDLENIFLKYKFDEDEAISSSDLSLADISNQLLLSAIPKNKIESLNQLSSKKGIICINDLSSSGTATVYGNTEKQSRCKLASVFRLVDMYGWNSSFNVVMTARPFSDKDHFLINPFGLMFHEITASALISVDFRGNILDFGSTVLEANPIAWVIHSALYSCRNNIRAIFELKTAAALAISSLDSGLLPICREAIVLGPFSILHDSPASVGDESKPSNLIQADWKNYLSSVMAAHLKVLIVPNCGIVICGETIEEAWHLLMNCQIACETQLKLGNLHMDDLYIPDKAAQAELFHQWRSTDIGGITPMANVSTNNSNQATPAHWRLGELEFEALMRHMDNNGYRTGYFYRQEYILQSDKPTKAAHESAKYSVEIPPSSTSTIEATKQSPEEDSKTSRSFNRSKSDKWFNTPNMYKLIEDTEDADNKLPYNFRNVQSNKKSARWASAKVPNFSAPTPQHPVTHGAYVAIGYHPSKSDMNRDKPLSQINPKELIENQKRVKNKYYHDTNTAGPISCLLDSEEARIMKSESLRKQIGLLTSPNDQVITAASKGIIQRGHKAVVYQDLFKPGNPFDVTADELADYHKEVDRKLHPDRYKSVEIKDDTPSKEETPEIRITLSPTESSLPPPDSDIPDASTSRRDTELSNRKPSANEHVSLPSNECHPFFQSDFDEDFNNLKITESVCTSSPKKRDTDEASRSNEIPSFNLSGDSTKGASNEGLKKSASMKDDKKKTFRSFSFKSLRRSKSEKESAELLENKGATLAAPGYGTITSETSGVDISNDELDKDTKSKKKKRKFKLPSFSKKKKDKSK